MHIEKSVVLAIQDLKGIYTLRPAPAIFRAYMRPAEQRHCVDRLIEFCLIQDMFKQGHQ
jgi:hypothetical protein